ncbi:type II toxin-antitoxin system VapC family toxin [Treponema sp. R80B11-R83G3]
MNRFLMDTNILLWYFLGSDRIDSIKGLIGSEVTDIFFSPVSLWEIAIKIKSGKLNLNIKELYAHAKKHNFVELPLTGDCLKAYLELPNIHKDPFDHIMLAQALTFPMRLITGDSLLADYSSLVMVI